jgi:bisphosphoglycerate-independent phosphoglycerate mutase (AlkP superfamily)
MQLMSCWIPLGLRKGGVLADVVPALPGVLGTPQPAEMTGQDLRVFKH